MNLKIVSLSAITVAALTAPAFAHHSFDMFDAQRTVTIQGTVKEFEWRNPHAWLRVLVNNENSGKPVLWSFELNSPGQLVPMGWRFRQSGRCHFGNISSDEGWHAWGTIYPGGA